MSYWSPCSNRGAGRVAEQKPQVLRPRRQVGDLGGRVRTRPPPSCSQTATLRPSRASRNWWGPARGNRRPSCEVSTAGRGVALLKGSELGGVPRGPRGGADLTTDLDLDDPIQGQHGPEVLRPVQSGTLPVGRDLDVLGAGNGVRVAVYHDHGERLEGDGVFQGQDLRGPECGVLWDRGSIIGGSPDLRGMYPSIRPLESAARTRGVVVPSASGRRIDPWRTATRRRCCVRPAMRSHSLGPNSLGLWSHVRTQGTVQGGIGHETRWRRIRPFGALLPLLAALLLAHCGASAGTEAGEDRRERAAGESEDAAMTFTERRAGVAKGRPDAVLLALACSPGWPHAGNRGSGQDVQVLGRAPTIRDRADPVMALAVGQGR